MKKILCLLFSLSIISTNINAQDKSNLLSKNQSFTGAKSSRSGYNSIFQLDTNDSNIIKKTFRNIENALNDPRLKGKLHVELVMFSGGTDVNLKSSGYEEDLKRLIAKGVTVAQCNNSLREKNLNRNDIYDFLAVVPSGAGEIILRESEGWAVVKP